MGSYSGSTANLADDFSRSTPESMHCIHMVTPETEIKLFFSHLSRTNWWALSSPRIDKTVGYVRNEFLVPLTLPSPSRGEGSGIPGNKLPGIIPIEARGISAREVQRSIAIDSI
jgi:hypothetical protein